MSVFSNCSLTECALQHLSFNSTTHLQICRAIGQVAWLQEVGLRVLRKGCGRKTVGWFNPG